MDGNQNFMPLPKKHGHGLLISFIICLVLLVSAAGFGVWAYLERQDYKFNSDQKSTAAAEEAAAQQKTDDDARFVEEEKYPLVPYVGPSQFGSVRLEYPKTWSGYVINKDSGGTPVSWYFHPNVVADTSNRANVFALRVEVVSSSYAESVDSYSNDAEKGVVRISPYTLPQVPNVVGTRVDGEVINDIQGSMILLPVRNMTLKIWTESQNFMGDFDNIILPTVTFSP